MSVSYDEAMETLVAMFSEVDKEVISMILESYQGHMEKTVEQLLVMTGEADGTEIVSRDPPPQAAPAGRPNSGGFNIPADFLQTGGGNPDQLSQMEQDEKFAKMLQDELFLEELRNNPEFRNQMGDDDNLRDYQRTGAPAEPRPRSSSGSGEPSFSSQLKAMGESTKKKFWELADSFRSRKGSGGEGGRKNSKYQTLGTDDDDALGFGNLSVSADTMQRRRTAGGPVDDDEDGDSSLQDRRVHRAQEMSSYGGGPPQREKPRTPPMSDDDDDSFGGGSGDLHRRRTGGGGKKDD